jgi:DNA polymerase
MERHTAARRAEELQRLATEAAGCTRCDLYIGATQTVWGEGDPNAAIMIVGQGPGETEDQIGRPFVGPAGNMLDRALEEAGLDRGQLYLTNIVKHWATAIERGRKVNRAPRASEVRACRAWLDAELAIVQPRVIVALGAPAAQALIDRDFKITRDRGIWRTGPNGTPTIASFHPSYLLRLQASDREAYAHAWAALVADLRAAKAALCAGS